MAQHTLTVVAFSSDDKTELDRGTLLTMDNAIDPGTGTIKLKATFPNARNRLWVARRNLPWPLAVIYVAVWTVLTVVRFRSVRLLRLWFAGFREGLGPGAGERRSMHWRTVWRLTRAGRPPIV